MLQFMFKLMLGMTLWRGICSRIVRLSPCRLDLGVGQLFVSVTWQVAQIMKLSAKNRQDKHVAIQKNMEFGRLGFGMLLDFI